MLRDGRRLKAKTRVVRTVAADEDVQFGETFAFRDLSAGLPGTRLHAAILGFDRFSRDAVLGDVTVPLDDSRLLSTLIDRRGVLETVELIIDPTPQAPQSPMTKVNYSLLRDVNCHFLPALQLCCERVLFLAASVCVRLSVRTISRKLLIRN